MNENELSTTIIGAAIEVHRMLGPGLLESVYEECLAYELMKRRVRFERQKPEPIRYKQVLLDCGFRIDLYVQNLVIVESGGATDPCSHNAAAYISEAYRM